MTIAGLTVTIAVLLLLCQRMRLKLRQATQEIVDLKEAVKRWKKHAADWENLAQLKNKSQVRIEPRRPYDFQRDPMNIGRKPVPGDFI